MFDRLDTLIVSSMAKHGIRMLRWSLGIIFLWFGVLKFFPGFSSAESLASRTMITLSFDLLSKGQALGILAVWESIIGAGLLLGIWPRFVLALLFLQMAGTFTPLVLYPFETFVSVPFVPTLEGQYIFKNLVLISAGIVIGATVRGDRAL